MGTGPTVGGGDDLLARAEAWRVEDPSPTDARTVQLLAYRVEDGDPEARAQLEDMFGADLSYGPDGWYGPRGAGPRGMNRAVVRRAAAGVAGWVLAGEAGDPRAGVVVGRDARHGSDAFATEAIEVLAGHGLPVHVLPDLIPTPVLAHAVRHLGAAAGIMVTGGHGPSTHSGCRVYDGQGRPLVPDQGAAVERHMAAAGPLSRVPLSGASNPLIRRVTLDLVDEYLIELVATVLRPRPDRPPVQVAYTPLHGVGGPTVRQACRQAGFITVHEVDEQAHPDPDLPTAPRPDPGRPEVLDRLRDLAAWAGADAALATDPDVDRLVMAVHDPERGSVRDPEAWKVLTGDELGCLLADHVIRRGGLPPEAVVATTIASSTLLPAMAAEAGVPCVQTLCGVPWLVRAPGPDRRLAFGYEEAGAFCPGDLVGEADGIGALLLAAEMVSDLAGSGLTVFHRLDELARRHGVHATGRWSAAPDDPDGAEHLAGALARLRAAPPPAVAGRRVVGMVDLRDGTARPDLAPADVVGLALDGARVVVRPGGTGSGLTAHVEVVEAVVDGDLASARARAEEGLAAVLAGLPPALGLGSDRRGPGSGAGAVPSPGWW